MRLLRVGLDTDYKAIHCDFPWAAAVVFFGKNDSGKTNLLETLLPGLTPESETSPTYWYDPTATRMHVLPAREADVLTIAFQAIVDLSGPTGEAVLGEWLQFEDIHPQLRYFQDDSEREFRRLPQPLTIGDFSFSLGTEPRPLPELLALLRTQLVNLAAKTCTRWDSLAGHYELLLDACLSSRIFSSVGGDIWWLPPLPPYGDKLANAASAVRSSIATRSWTTGRPAGIGGFVDAILDDLDPAAWDRQRDGFMQLRSWAQHYPLSDDAVSTVGGAALPFWDVVHLSSNPESLERVLKECVAFIQGKVAAPPYSSLRGVPTGDPWYQQSVQGFTRINPRSLPCAAI